MAGRKRPRGCSAANVRCSILVAFAPQAAAGGRGGRVISPLTPLLVAADGCVAAERCRVKYFDPLKTLPRYCCPIKSRIKVLHTNGRTRHIRGLRAHPDVLPLLRLVVGLLVRRMLPLPRRRPCARRQRRSTHEASVFKVDEGDLLPVADAHHVRFLCLAWRQKASA